MAQDRVIKTLLELSGEGTYLEKMNQVTKALKLSASNQSLVNAQYSKGDKSLAALAARQASYADKLEAQRRKLQILNEEYEKTVAEEGEASDAALKLKSSMNYAAGQVAKTEKAMEELEKAINGEAEASEKAKKKTEEQRKALKELGEQAEKAAGKMAKVLTAATVSAVTVSAKGFMDFESEMSNVETLADTTAVSMEELSKQALQASNVTGVAATEIAQGAYTALSSGVDTANAMDYITQAAKAAKAGQSDLDTVVNGSTSIINAWKLSYSDAASVFEKMLVAQDKGKTTLGELSSQIGQITGIAPQLNISLDETLAAVAALTKNGVQTSSAITGLRAVMSNVLKPTSEAAEAAEALGLEFNTAALQSKGLTGFLQDVLDKTGGSAEELAKLFGSVEGLSQIMLLGGSAAEDYSDALAAMEGSAGRLDAAFSTVTDNSASRLSMSLNKLKNNAIEFGQSLAPYIDLASEALGKLSERISAMTQEEQMSLLQTALWTAGGLKAISMLSKMVSTIKTLTTLASPIGRVVTALGLLAAGIVAVNKIAEANSLDGKWEKLSEDANKNLDGNMNMIITSSVEMGTVDTSGAESELLTSINNVYENVKKALTDGQTDTPEVVAQLKTDVADLFATANSRIEGMGTEAGTYAEELKTLEADTTAWIESMAGKSTEYVNQHLGELEQMEERVKEIIAQINEGNAAVRDENKGNYDMTRAGATTNQDTIAKGAAWAYTNRALDLQEIKDNAAAQMAEIDQAFADGLMTSTEHLAAEDKINAEMDSKIQAAEETYKARMGELIQGIMEAFGNSNPEQADLVQTLMDNLDLQEQVNQIYEGLQNATIDPTQAQAAWKSIYDQVFGTGTYDAELDTPRLPVEEIESRIKEAMGQLDLSDLGLTDTLNELLSGDAGAALGVDTSGLEGVFEAAMVAVGSAGADGLADGLETSQSEAESAATTMAQGTIDAAKDTFDEHSPSKVFDEIGQNLTQGLINGINSKQNAATTAMRKNASAVTSAAKSNLRFTTFYEIGQNVGQGLINGMASKQNAIIATARKLASAASAAVKSELDINSPSRVMQKLGGYTADGFIVGLENKIDAVQRTVRGMVSTDGLQTARGSTSPEGQRARSAQQTTVNIKYSGAFTQREARRFGREFALQIAADNAGKGG